MRVLNLDGVQAPTSKRLKAGGYVCVVKKVYDESKSSRLDVSIDIAEGEYKNFYEEKGKADGKKASKIFYPNKAMWYDEKGAYAQSNLANFKGMITAFEESNKGFKFDYDETELVGKLVGVIFRDEEVLMSDGKVITTAKPFMFRSVESIREGDFTIPNVKKLKVENDETPFDKVDEDEEVDDINDFDLDDLDEDIDSEEDPF